ncbi:hypothetical protein IMX26_04075 [Clostridium sp. 'deep sea']|uniref:hypothetical protein n=1 Tax=Clostridium sp. 'deep sea' TaxID=2779445 RepID=UPI0018966C43|nr:hypothetical protein [Clostridium sp. 'deep sea']QOR36001.1 hypothetical protein IMX26_04075 [Clostridium sp. 'deep sea']
MNKKIYTFIGIVLSSIILYLIVSYLNFEDKFVVISTYLSLLISIVVLFNSISIKEYTIKQKKIDLLNSNKKIKSIKVKLAAINDLLGEGSKVYKEKDILKTQINSCMGSLNNFKKLFNKEAKNAMQNLCSDDLYSNGDSSKICYYIGLILAEIEVICNG